jgi:hypothetical protein
VDSLFLDPDAKVREELNWVGRRRVKPRWTLTGMYPDKAEQIKQLEKCADKPSDARAYEPASELIEYYEVYSLVQLQNYAPSFGNDAEIVPMLGDGPMKYTFSGDTLLAAEPWEIPLFEDDAWPCDWFDPLEKPGCLWPAAPLETSLGHIKALNWIYTLYLSKMRVTTRTPLVVMSQNGQGLKDDQIVKLLKGHNDMDVIKVTVNGNTLKLSDMVQQFSFATGVEEFERFASIVGQAFEKSSGLYEVLYSGTTPTQIRNAATANMIQSSSQSRVSNMQARMEQFMGRLTRRTLFAARFIEDPSCRLIFGNLMSMGVGVDGLQTVCDTVLFGENSWVPGDNQQGVDRLDRMGQTSPVTAIFLVARGSIDEKIVSSAAKKTRTIHTALDAGL